MKPILFNTEMVKAILEGRKTVTRRVIKGQDKKTMYAGRCVLGAGLFDNNTSKRVIAPPYQVGDILYVRETWNEWQDGYVYKAWCSPFPQVGAYGQWKPSIHMPKEAARLFLRVTGVRVERLQDIRPLDIIAEGIKVDDDKLKPPYTVNASMFARELIKKFGDLWNSTVKKDQIDTYGWCADPYVWVIEFKNISEEVKNGRV